MSELLDDDRFVSKYSDIVDKAVNQVLNNKSSSDAEDLRSKTRHGLYVTYGQGAVLEFDQKLQEGLQDSRSESRVEREIENPIEYVKSLVSRGISPKLATKDAPVILSLAKDGQEVKTYTKDGLETINTAKGLDAEANGIIVTSLDRNGKVLLNNDGNPNMYLISLEYLLENYTMTPNANKRTVIEIPENISIKTNWGEIQHLPKGSFLNISNSSDIYGIAPSEFSETYSILKHNIEVPEVYK